MAVTTKVIVDQVGLATSETGNMDTVQIRMRKQVWNGSTLMSDEFHRVIILPVVSADIVKAALNSDLDSKGFGAVDDTSWNAMVPTMVSLAQTPSNVSAYAALLAASG